MNNPITLIRTKAGTNEKIFNELIKNKAPEITLLGKRKFKEDNVEISVDQSFDYDDFTYLIEIDSGNMAKLLVGQYVLLNYLHLERSKKPFFLVVHTYKSYRPQRTLNNLNLINKKIFDGQGIPFGSLHINSLKDSWSGGIEKLVSLIETV